MLKYGETVKFYFKFSWFFERESVWPNLFSYLDLRFFLVSLKCEKIIGFFVNEQY